MGESRIRGNVSHGDGVYKSTDAGKTWKHLGLRETRQIGARPRPSAEPRPRLRRRARAHLRARTRSAASSARRTAARPGRRCCSSTTRRARSTWRWIRRTRASLYAGTLAGAAHAVEPRERRPGQRPLEVDRRRRHLEGARRQGPAEGPLGHASASRSRRRGPSASARSIEAEEGGVFRSRRRRRAPGQRINDERNAARSAPGTTRHVYADPKNADTRLRAQRRSSCSSTDGGKTFAADPRRRTATTTTCGSSPTIRGG